MKKIALAMALMLTACGNVSAGEQWQTTDYVLLGSALGLQAIDCAQAHDMVRKQRAGHLEYKENNPLLKGQPSLGDIDKACAIAMTGTVGLSFVLPQSWRRGFLGGVVGVEAAVVIYNHSIGLRVDF